MPVDPKYIQALSEKYGLSTEANASVSPSAQPTQNMGSQAQEQGPIMGGYIPKIGAGLGTILGGIAGTAIPIPFAGTALGAGGGAAAGYAGGKALENTLEDLLGRQQETREQQLTSTATGTAMAGGSGFLTDLVFSTLFPLKRLGALRSELAAKSGKVASGTNIATSLLEKAGGPGIAESEKGAVGKLAGQAAERLTGKEIPIPELIERKITTQRAFTEAGKVGKTGKATFEKMLGDTYRTEMKNLEPMISTIDQMMHKVYGIKRFTKSNIGRFLPWIILGKLFYGGRAG